MGVNAVGSGVPSMGGVDFSGGGSDPQLKALEQKLQKLTQEKKQAVRNKDEEKVKQIEQLKKKKQKEDREDRDGTAGGPGVPAQSPAPSDGTLGEHVDRLA